MWDYQKRRDILSCGSAILFLTLTSCGSDDAATSNGGSTGGGTSTTATAPDAPTVTLVTVGDGFLTLAFDPPSANGGAAVTAYDVTCEGGGSSFTGAAVSSPVNVFGLTNGTEYNCTATAANSAGTSGVSNAGIGTPDPTPSTGLPSEFSQFGNNVTVVYNQAAGTVTLEAVGQPDHYSPYWDPDGTSGLYVDAGAETTVARMSPGFIDEYTNRYFLTVNASPQLASSTTATTLGAIGIAVTGAPIFNGQEGPNNNLDSGVISGFDNFGAHTGPQVYHYHLEPTPISNNDSNLIAILADGFFLYGRIEWGTGAPPTDLDASGGHVGPTQFNSTPHYHYHIVDDIYSTINGKDDYLLFDGAYQGTPANITN